MRAQRAILGPVRKMVWVLALAAAGCSSSPSQPSASLQCAAVPTSGTAPLTVNFTATVSASKPYTLFIAFGDGTSGNNPNVAHVYSQPGVYAASIEQSEGGAPIASCGQTITVVPFVASPAPSSLQVSFRVTPDPPVGPGPLTVKFNMCNTFDPNPNDVISFAFDFGDGSHFGGFCRTEHTYKAGSKQYDAHLCVSNSIQTDCKDYVVQVE
jgi:PKD repeat protein